MSGFIPWSSIDRVLAAGRSIWISTTRPDGRPHAVPVWYIWDDRCIYFITRRDVQKAKNLAHQPWVVVHAGDGDDVILLEGRVGMVTDEHTLQHINTLYADKYVAPRSGARATIFEADCDLYQVRVKHIMAWEYGDIGTRTDWHLE